MRFRPAPAFLPAVLCAVLTAALACAPRGDSPPRILPAETAGGERRLTILAINDVYRIEGAEDGVDGGLARVRALRRELERDDPYLLVLHAGDLLYPSLLSRTYDGGQMIDVLNHLDGAPRAFDPRLLVTFGNHEFDRADRSDAALLERQLESSDFTWLDTNVEWARDETGQPLIAAPTLAASRLLDLDGLRVGIFGLTTDLQHPEYVEEFTDPTRVAAATTASLRAAGAELVVALTHLTLDEDLSLVQQSGSRGPDLVIGGHEHHRICRRVTEAEVEECASEPGAVVSASLDEARLVIKADAEARSAAVVRITVPAARTGSKRRAPPPTVTVSFRGLDAAAPEDPRLRELVDDWLARHDRDYCASLREERGCLTRVVGHSRVKLVGEELEIRRYETNLGNWIVDQALAGYADHGVDAAFVNAGSLRLNQDLPPGEITLRHIEEIFQFPSALRVLEISGAELQQVLDHAVTDWTGNGKWLQVAGIAFRHDPATGTADRATLLTADGRRPITPDERLRVVTNEFLVDPATGQDGYTMLGREMWIEGVESRDLRTLVVEALAAAGQSGIAPVVAGRICTEGREGPCLAMADEDR